MNGFEKVSTCKPDITEEKWIRRKSAKKIDKYLFADYLICHEETVHVCGQEKRIETA